MTISEIQFYQILRGKLGDKGAEELVSFVRSEIRTEFGKGKDILATKEDLYQVKIGLMRSIYVVGLVQFLAIVGSLLAVLNFVLK